MWQINGSAQRSTFVTAAGSRRGVLSRKQLAMHVAATAVGVASLAAHRSAVAVVLWVSTDVLCIYFCFASIQQWNSSTFCKMFYVKELRFFFFCRPWDVQVDWWVLERGGQHPHIDKECKKGRNGDKKTVIQSIALREEQHFRSDLREGREEWGTRAEEGTQ